MDIPIDLWETHVEVNPKVLLEKFESSFQMKIH
jgi:hypothetical protein